MDIETQYIIFFLLCGSLYAIYYLIAYSYSKVIQELVNRAQDTDDKVHVITRPSQQSKPVRRSSRATRQNYYNLHHGIPPKLTNV